MEPAAQAAMLSPLELHDAHILSLGLLSGNLDELPPDMSFLFARAGLVYLFAASGLHLRAASLVADLLSYPVRRFLREGRSAEAAKLLARGALTLWLCVDLGAAAPLVRGSLVLVLTSGARLFELDADRRWVLLVSLLACCALGRGSPLSFAMTTLALTGSFFGRPRWLGPWLFTLPLSVAAFGLFSPLGPLYALAAQPFLAYLLLPLAIAARVLAALHLPAAPLEHATDLLAALLHASLREALLLLDLSVWVRPLPWALASLAFLLAAANSKRRPRAALAAVAAGLTLPLLFPLPAISALDVGQGDGIYLRTAGGELLEDVGPPGLHGRAAPVCRSLEALGRGPLDHVLLSHFDLDHRGGLDSLLARHAVRGALWFREDDLSAKHAEKVLLAAERARVPIRFLDDHAAPAGLECHLAPFPDGNDSCPLCRAPLVGGQTALLTGDMSEKAETWFVSRLEPFPRADILKVAHHGSRTSSSAAFLAASGARTALISVGARNRYGHPAPETLARLARAGMPARRTDLEGSVSVYGFLTDEIMRRAPPESRNGSRVNPGSPAMAR